MSQVVYDRDLVQRLADVESGLTEWEVEFVDKLARQAKQYGDRWRGLSEKQREIAESIADRIGV